MYSVYPVQFFVKLRFDFKGPIYLSRIGINAHGRSPVGRFKIPLSIWLRCCSQETHLI